MRHSYSFVAAAMLTAGVLVGCGSQNEYAPSASSTNLAAYAATAKYPSNLEPTENTKVTAIVNGGNGQMTLRNFGTGAMSNFNLWVNQSYVLHVDRLDPNSFKVFDPSLFYNSAGNNLAGTDATMIKKVQIVTTANELLNVQGPQIAQ